MSEIDVNHLCMGCMETIEDPAQPCPHCGYLDDGRQTAPHHLAPHTILYGKYMIGRVLGEGGFGITYIGWDLFLNLRVAVKEYYPSGFATRSGANTALVYPYAGEKQVWYEEGKEKFITEARNLARFSGSPGIVSVLNFFLDNGTAYLVMEYVQGVTLKKYVEEHGGRLAAGAVLALARPLIQSLAVIHKTGVIHRDISPDNIMVLPDGSIKLLDFGAAKDIRDENAAKSRYTQLRPGYAPEEQYRTDGKHGPWTDVYALCATLYFAVTGLQPEEAIARVQNDPLRPPSAFGAALSPAKERALMKGLAVRQSDRFQDMGALSDALYRESSSPPPPGPLPKAESAPISPAPAPLGRKKLPRFIPAAAIAMVVIAVWLAIAFSGSGGKYDGPPSVSSSSGSASDSMYDSTGGSSDGSTDSSSESSSSDTSNLSMIPVDGTDSSSSASDGSEENYYGNVAYNLNNGGYVAEQGDYIFLSDAQNTEFGAQTGIQRIDVVDGSSVILSATPAKQLNVVGDYLYYISENDRGIWKLGIDGSGETRLIDGAISSMIVMGDWIYFIDLAGRIYKVDVYGSNFDMLSDIPPSGDSYWGLDVDIDRTLYFCSSSGIMKLDTGGMAEGWTPELVSSVYASSVFYTIDHESREESLWIIDYDREFCEIKLSAPEEKLQVMDDSAYEIVFGNDGIYYIATNGATVYYRDYDTNTRKTVYEGSVQNLQYTDGRLWYVDDDQNGALQVIHE